MKIIQNVIIAFVLFSMYMANVDASNFPKVVEEKCGYMINKFEEWVTKLDDSKTILPRLISRAESHGLGDKLGGIATAIMYAMEHERPLEIVFPGVSNIFEIPEFARKYANITDATESRVSAGCFERRGFPFGRECDQFMKEGSPERECWKTNPLHTRGQRMCVTDKTCSDIMKENKEKYNAQSVSLAQTVGCALRVALNPTETIMNEKYDWWIEGEVRHMSLQEVQDYLSNYVSVALQIRVGDSALHSSAGKSGQPTKFANSVSTSLDCANSLFHEDPRSKSKEMRFIFASDSQAERERVKDHMGRRLVMLMERPHHISDDHSYRGVGSQEEKLELKEEIAKSTTVEWMLIGLTDYTMVYSLTRIRRISWFPYTSLLWNLKPYVYDGKTCTRIPLAHKGGMTLRIKEGYDPVCKSGYSEDFDYLNF